MGHFVTLSNCQMFQSEWCRGELRNQSAANNSRSSKVRMGRNKDIVRCFVRAAKVLGMKHHNSKQNTSKGTSHQNPEDNEDNWLILIVYLNISKSSNTMGREYWTHLAAIQGSKHMAGVVWMAVSWWIFWKLACLTAWAKKLSWKTSSRKSARLSAEGRVGPQPLMDKSTLWKLFHLNRWRADLPHF